MRGRPRRAGTRRKFLAAAGGGVAAVVIGTGRARAQTSAVLRVARGADARSLDPHINARLYDRPVCYTLYEPLLDADAHGNFVPKLATSWQVGSTGLVITFRLRQNVVFHDGTPFTADVVKWNMERILDPATGSEHRARFQGIVQGVETPDKYTVQYYLTRPYPPFFSEMTDRPGMMVSPTAVQKYGQDFGRNPVGTGPFRFQEWVLGTRVVVQRNERYWDRPKIQSNGIIFTDFEEPAVADARLRGGELDLVALEGLPADDLIGFQKDPSYRVVQSPAFRWESIQMKVDVPPFDNLGVRQAMMYGINRQQIKDVIYRGLGQATGKIFHEGWWADPSYTGPTFDLAMAKQKLKESGYADHPVPLTMYVLSSDVPLGEMVQAQLQAVGFQINIRLVSERDQYPMVLRGEIPFTIPSDWTPRVDPHGLAYILWDSKGYANSSHYKNAQVDKLLDGAAVTYDRAARTQAYRQAERLIVNDAPYIFYYATPNSAIMRPQVQGFAYGFDLIPRVSETWVKS